MEDWCAAFEAFPSFCLNACDAAPMFRVSAIPDGFGLRFHIAIKFSLRWQTVAAKLLPCVKRTLIWREKIQISQLEMLKSFKAKPVPRDPEDVSSPPSITLTPSRAALLAGFRRNAKTD
jgi:hypothetical protein